MSTVSVGSRRSAKNTDYDAAQALLDLQSNINISPGPSKFIKVTAGWRENENNREDIEKAAKLILSCFITSDNSNNTVARKGNSQMSRQTPTRLKNANLNLGTPVNENHRNAFSTRNISYKNTSTPVHGNDEGKLYEKKTCDSGTQTEDHYFNPNIQIMETTIKNLCDRIKLLEAQIKTSLDQSADEDSFETNRMDVSLSGENIEDDPDYEMNLDYTDVNESKFSKSSFDGSPTYVGHSQTNKNVIHNGVLSNHNTSSCDLVPIGDGNATVPSRVLKHINWNSYSSATRKLLTAVFSRRILATHSLTGKPSPAFPNKPAKKKLDPKLVHDIVQTVVERCRVPENVVRTSITTKCADESKMFRTREKNKSKRSNKKNRENVPPTSESESDDY